MPAFEDLIVWREAALLAAEVVKAVPQLSGPGATAAADQMVRAADSIPANIAEGYGRGITRDCLRMLRIARASSMELESHLRVAQLSGRMANDQAEALVDHVRRVRYLMWRFAASVERRMNAA